jgi:hypothetical protein
MLGPLDLRFDPSRVGGYMRRSANYSEKKCINGFFEELGDSSVDNDCITVHRVIEGRMVEIYLVSACGHVVEILRRFGNQAKVLSLKRGDVSRMDAALWGEP